MVIWDDEPGGNVEHIAEHGVTVEEFEEILFDDSIPEDVSQSTGRPCKFGWTTTGKHIVIVYEVDDEIIVPITAYEVAPRHERD